MIKVPLRTDKTNHLTRPEQAIAHLNKVIASGGDLDTIKRAVSDRPTRGLIAPEQLHRALRYLGRVFKAGFSDLYDLLCE